MDAVAFISLALVISLYTLKRIGCASIEHELAQSYGEKYLYQPEDYFHQSSPNTRWVLRDVEPKGEIEKSETNNQKAKASKSSSVSEQKTPPQTPKPTKNKSGPEKNGAMKAVKSSEAQARKYGESEEATPDSKPISASAAPSASPTPETGTTRSAKLPKNLKTPKPTPKPSDQKENRATKKAEGVSSEAQPRNDGESGKATAGSKPKSARPASSASPMTETTPSSELAKAKETKTRAVKRMEATAQETPDVNPPQTSEDVGSTEEAVAGPGPQPVTESLRPVDDGGDKNKKKKKLSNKGGDDDAEKNKKKIEDENGDGVDKKKSKKKNKGKDGGDDEKKEKKKKKKEEKERKRREKELNEAESELAGSSEPSAEIGGINDVPTGDTTTPGEPVTVPESEFEPQTGHDEPVKPMETEVYEGYSEESDQQSGPAAHAGIPYETAAAGPPPPQDEGAYARRPPASPPPANLDGAYSQEDYDASLEYARRKRAGGAQESAEPRRQKNSHVTWGPDQVVEFNADDPPAFYDAAESADGAWNGGQPAGPATYAEFTHDTPAAGPPPPLDEEAWIGDQPASPPPRFESQRLPSPPAHVDPSVQRPPPPPLQHGPQPQSQHQLGRRFPAGFFSNPTHLILPNHSNRPAGNFPYYPSYGVAYSRTPPPPPDHGRRSAWADPFPPPRRAPQPKYVLASAWPDPYPQPQYEPKLEYGLYDDPKPSPVSGLSFGDYNTKVAEYLAQRPKMGYVEGWLPSEHEAAHRYAEEYANRRQQGLLV